MNKTLQQQLREAQTINYDKVIKRLKQIVEEDKYSKQGLRAFIRKDILKNMDGMLELVFRSCVKKVDKYRTGSYWLSKDIRIAQLAGMETDDIVLDMFISVLPIQQVTLIQGIAANLGKTLDYENPFDGITTAAEILGACVETGLFDIWNDPMKLVCNFIISDEIITLIDKCKYPNPMRIPPDRWVDNNRGGYITIKQHCVLKQHNNHTEHQGLDALNIAQKVEWVLDQEVLATAETSEKPLNTQDKYDAFHLFKKNSEIVYKEIGDNPFHFVYRNDSRGRQYSQGYYINHQSNEYRKAMLSFAKKQLITGA